MSGPSVIQILLTAQDDASGVLDKITTGALHQLGEAAVDALGKAAQAVASFGADSIKVAGDFEAGMNRLASVAGDSLSQAGFSLDDVRTKALQLGADTAFSAAQAQDAMINLAKGGVPIADIMGQATDATLALAAAGELDLANAADIVSKQLGVWADTGVSAAQVADLMAQAANASTVDVDELALGLANVGGVAKVSGVSFQDLTQTMALLAPGFSSASDAGTSFKTMLLALQGKSSDAVGVMQKLGIITTDYTAVADSLGVSFDGSAGSMASLQEAINSFVTTQSQAVPGTKAWGKAMHAFLGGFQVNAFYDSSGAMKDMGQVAQILQDSLRGLSEEEKTAALNTMFGTDAYRAAAFLAEAGAAGFDAMGTAMAGAGSAAEQAAIRNQGFNFALDALKGSLETVQIIVGSALLPVLTSLINDVLTPGVNTVMAFVQAFLAAADPFGFLVTQLNALIPGLGSFVAFVSANLLPILAGIGAAIVAVVVPAFWAWAAAAIPAAAATALALAPVLAPILAIGAAVALLVAAWQNNWFGIQGIVAAVWAQISPVFAQLVTWLQGAIPAAIAYVAALWSGTLAPAFAALGAFIVGTVVPALVQLGSWLLAQLPTAIAALGALWNGVLLPALSALGSLLFGTVIPALAQVVAWFVANIPTAVMAVVTAFTTVASVVGSVIATVISVVSSVVQAVVTAWNAVASATSTAWNAVTTATSTAWNAIVAVITSVAGTIGSAVAAVTSVVVTILQAAWNTVVFLTQAAWGALWSYIGPPLTAAAAAVAGATAAIVGALQSAWATVVSATSSAWASVVAVIGPPLASAAAAVASTAASIVAALSAAWASVQAATSAAWNALLGAITSVVTTLRTIVGGAVAAVVSALTGGWQQAQAATSGPWTQIQTIIRGAMQLIQTIIQAGVAIVQTVMRGAWAVVVAAAQNDFGRIPSILSGIWATIQGIFDDGVAAIRDIASQLASAAISLGQNIIDGVVTGIGNAGGAIADKLRGLASSALDAAKSALGIHSPSRVFAAEVGTPIVDGIVQGIGAASPKATTAMLELAGKLVDLVDKGVDAFGKLRDLGSVPQSAITAFADSLMRALTTFSHMAMTWDKGMMSAASQFTYKANEVIETMAKGVDMLLKLQDFQGVPDAAIRAFGNALDGAMREMVRIASFQTLLGLSGAQAFAESAGKIVAIIGPAVDGLSKLAEFGAVSDAAIQTFGSAIATLVGNINYVAGLFAGQPLGMAAAFAETASTIVGLLSSGVDALTKLIEFVAPSQEAIQTFGSAIAILVGSINYVAGLFRGQPISQAAAFAESAGTIVGLLGTGVDAFAKLTDFVAPAASSIIAFGTAIRQVVATLATVAAGFADGAVRATATFADGAGRVVAVIGPAVDAFAKLPDLIAPAPGQVKLLGDGLVLVVGLLWFAARLLSADALDAVGVFADGAGKILAVIGPAVDAFAKLPDLIAPAPGQVKLLGDGLVLVVGMLWFAARLLSADALDAVVAFADGAGKVVAVVGPAVEGFTKLADFAGVPAGAVHAFGVALANTVAVFIQVTSRFVADSVASAATFADGAGRILSTIGSGVEGLIKLADFGGVPAGAFHAFGVALANTVAVFIQVTNQFVASAVAAAGGFADGAGKVLGTIASGVDGFVKLAEFAGVPLGAIHAFKVALLAILGVISQLASTLTGTAIAQAAQIARATDTIVGAVTHALDAFASLGRASGELSGYVNAFVAAVAQLMQQFQVAVVPPSVTIGHNIAVGIANGITAGTPAIVRAVTTAVNAALLAAKQALGIASPSKVFEADIGLQAGAGLAQGLERSIAPVTAAARNLALSAASSASLGGGLAPGAAAAPATSSSRTVMLQVAPGAVVVHAAPGQSSTAVGEAAVSSLLERVRQLQPT